MNRAPIGEQQLEEIAHILAPIINELAFVGGAILLLICQQQKHYNCAQPMI